MLDSSNNPQLDKFQIKSHLNDADLNSFLSKDLLKKIEDDSPRTSEEVKISQFVKLNIPPTQLCMNFDVNDLNLKNFNEISNLLFSEEKEQNKYNTFSSFEKKVENLKNLNNNSRDEVRELINDSYSTLFDNNLNIVINGKFEVGEEENINLNEELLFSKLIESLNSNSEKNCNQISNLEEINLVCPENLKNNFNNKEINKEVKSEKGNLDNSKNGNDKEIKSNIPNKININNNFKYHIINNFPFLNYYNHLLSLNPYVLNANLIYKINYLHKLQNLVMNEKKDYKLKSNNFQFGKSGWTCLYCNNFNYESKLHFYH